MKKKTRTLINFITTIILVICITTSCQPTPKENVVVGKGKEEINNMLDKTKSTPTPSVEGASAVIEPILNTYEAQEKMECSFTSKITDGTLNVKVDAPIILPEYAPSIVTVKPNDITYEQVEPILNMLVADRPLYFIEYEGIKTKQSVQSSIDHYLHEIACCENDPESKDISDNYKKKVQKLYKELETVPASVDEVDVVPKSSVNKDDLVFNGDMYQTKDGAYVIPDDHIGQMKINAQNVSKYYDLFIEGGKNESVYLNAQNKSDKLQRFYYIKYNDQISIKNDIKIMEGFSMSLEDALNKAKPIVDSIDPSFVLTDTCATVEIDYSKDDCPETPFGYTLIYSRNYNGVSSNHTRTNTFINGVGQPEHNEVYKNDVFLKLYPQEQIVITVGVDGIQSFRYDSPLNVLETIATEVELLPFDKIEKIFKDKISLNDELMNDTYMNIKRIKLGMMRIAKPDSDEYLVIPVWDFYGGSISSDTGTVSEDKIYCLYGDSFLTINAIDGSIIDRELGY